MRRSSPVLPTTTTPPGSWTRSRPRRNLAAPTPPASATSMGLPRELVRRARTRIAPAPRLWTDRGRRGSLAPGARRATLGARGALGGRRGRGLGGRSGGGRRVGHGRRRGERRLGLGRRRRGGLRRRLGHRRRRGQRVRRAGTGRGRGDEDRRRDRL